MDECIKCGEQSETRLGSDPDMKGIPVCGGDCKGDVQLDLLLVFSQDEEFDMDWFEDKYNLNE